MDNYYISQIKMGLRPTLRQLKDFCSANQIEATNDQLRQVPLRFEASATFSRWTKVKNDHYVTNLIPKPGQIMTFLFGTCFNFVAKLGNVFIDLCWFRPGLAGFNNNNKYILVGCDELSQMIVAHPMRNKKQETWHAALVKMILTDFPVKPNYFITDRQLELKNNL